jgi:HK97 family phage prohead protease
MRTARGQKRATPLVEVLEVRTDGELPDGVCGILLGVAVVYNVIDAYGTRFRPGCLDRTKREKLAAGKVKLFADHEGTTRAHIGYVKILETQGDREVMTGWLFDTAAGRQTKEYLSACLRSGGYTGYSIGFYPRETDTVQVDGVTVYDFVEIELDEVSNTPRPAVPGADALGVRRDATPAALLPTPEAMRAALRVAVDTLGISVVQAELAARTHASNATPDDSAAPPRDAEGLDSRDGTGAPAPGATTATMDERVAAVRRSYPSR